MQDAFVGISAAEKKRLLASLTRLLQGLDTLHAPGAGKNARAA